MEKTKEVLHTRNSVIEEVSQALGDAVFEYAIISDEVMEFLDNMQTPNTFELIDEKQSLIEENKRLKAEKAHAMRIAMIFGYKQCEKGHNIDLAIINFNKLKDA